MNNDFKSSKSVPMFGERVGINNRYDGLVSRAFSLATGAILAFAADNLVSRAYAQNATPDPNQSQQSSTNTLQLTLVPNVLLADTNTVPRWEYDSLTLERDSLVR